MSLNESFYKNFTVIIFDTSGNKLEQVFPISISKLGGLEYHNYDPKEILIDFEYSTIIVTTQNELPTLNVSLLNFSIYPNNVSYRMYISGDTVEKQRIYLETGH